jgi:periplasmic protein TonB
MERQGLRSHLSGSVPISIAVHLVVVAVLLLIPLSEIVQPVPADRLPDFISAAPMPPPPPVATQPSTRPPSGPVAASPAFPISAPDEIPPDSASPATTVDAIPDSTGVPAGEVGMIENLGPPIAVHAPEPPRPTGPVRVAQLPVTPRKIVDVRPVYPEIARAARREGTVIMEAVLDPTGAVTQLRVVRSVPLLDDAALDAVRQWKYTPSVYGGHPVSVLMTITIRFTLSQ